MNIKLTQSSPLSNKVLLRENKIDRDQEHFWIIGLDNNHKVLFFELIGLGRITLTTIEPMNVFRMAILKNAVQVILVHNDPSGELKPSEEDQNITDRLIQIGRIIQIQVIDHLILTPTSYLSFKDIGLLAQLQTSPKYIPPYEIAERIQKEEQKLRKEAFKIARERGVKKGKEQKAQETALNFLKMECLTLEQIAGGTGLSVEEIEELEKDLKTDPP